VFIFWLMLTEVLLERCKKQCTVTSKLLFEIIHTHNSCVDKHYMFENDGLFLLAYVPERALLGIYTIFTLNGRVFLIIKN
jgi:hypothetical protein